MDLISLYEEMRTKWGFDDGEAVPGGIEQVRNQIINIIEEGLPENTLYAPMAYDRPGVHNWCFIVYTRKGSSELLTYKEEKLLIDEELIKEILSDADIDIRISYFIELEHND